MRQQEHVVSSPNQPQSSSHGFLSGFRSSSANHARTDRSQRHARRTKQSSSVSTSTAGTSNASTTSHPVWEMETSYDEPASLSSLSNDLQLRVFEFCDVSSIRRMMQVNHHYRDLLAVSDEAKNLWSEQCHRKWSWLSSDEALDIVDDLHVPTAAVDASTPNLSLLLSVAADKSTTSDESIFSPCRWNSILRRFLPDNSVEASHLRTMQTETGETAVQFFGPVGRGDRCIRADQPLPRPQLLVKSIRRAKWHAFWNRFLLQKRSRHPTALWRPFVAPLAQQHETPQLRQVVNLTPRLISYFEVTILPGNDDNSNDNNNNENETNDNSTTTTTTTSPAESVGIGLATEEFDLHHSMPGWDGHSYGYHGDDGGIYHGQGQLNRSLGAKFGASDTVGCGLDYHKRAIFFTRNGQFMGYAFENLSWKTLHQKDFYPVVGVDTHCPVRCNFGVDRPFVFNLSGMMKEQRAVVVQTLMPQKKHR